MLDMEIMHIAELMEIKASAIGAAKVVA